MKKVAIIYEKDSEQKNVHNEVLCQMFENCIDKEEYLTIRIEATQIENLTKNGAQYFVVLDGAGYRYTTLLENLQYNIMPRKQLHLFTKEGKEKIYKEGYAINIYVAVEEEQSKGKNYFGFQSLKRNPDGDISKCKENCQILSEVFNSMIEDENRSLGS